MSRSPGKLPPALAPLPEDVIQVREAQTAGKVLEVVAPILESETRKVMQRAFKAIEDGNLDGDLAKSLWIQLWSVEKLSHRLSQRSKVPGVY